MTLTYRLDRDIVARTAAQLNWNLKQVRSSIRISNNGTMINGKSLVGILSGHMRFNDIITITIDEPTDVDEIKEYFNEVGREI
jgi:phosphotransferase system HPr-like phosphotransfer protein